MRFLRFKQPPGENTRRLVFTILRIFPGTSLLSKQIVSEITFVSLAFAYIDNYLEIYPQIFYI